MGIVKSYFFSVLDFLFPIFCIFCGELDILSKKIGVCKKCYNNFPQKEENKNLCRVCKTPLVEGDCVYCNSRNIFFNELVFLTYRDEVERNLIQNIKFHNKPYLSLYFRIGIRKKLGNWQKKHYQAIVVITSNKKTVKKRPIHPCKFVTEYLVKMFKVAVISPFQKVSHQLQSGQSYRDRFIHARMAFEIHKKYKNQLRGNYLLVDDVFTTGATINELARLLILNGAHSVDILVMTRARQEDD